MSKPSLQPYLWMLLGSLAFACMGGFARALGERCDWQIIALARALLALIIAALLAWAAGARLVWLRPRTLWMRSIAGSISMVCTFFAFTHLPVSNVMTLTNMFPIWVAFLSWPLLHEPPPGHVWLSVISGVAGVILIRPPEQTDGSFATVVAASSSFFTAIAMIGLHRLQGIDPRAIIVHFSSVGVVFSLVALAAFDHPQPLGSLLEGEPLLLLLALGVTATVGQLFLTKAFAAGPPAKISVVGLTQIVFALALDCVLWNQQFTAWTLLGMGLVVAPSAWLMVHRKAGP